MKDTSFIMDTCSFSGVVKVPRWRVFLWSVNWLVYLLLEVMHIPLYNGYNGHIQLSWLLLQLPYRATNTNKQIKGR